MITGIVNANYEASVTLSIRGSTGVKQDIDFLLDTGFNGSLTLPPAIIHALDLVWSTRSLITLGNGVQEWIDVYVAFVLWDGQLRTILVESADTDALLGMNLLKGHNLTIEAIIGGLVTIQARP